MLRIVAACVSAEPDFHILAGKMLDHCDSDAPRMEITGTINFFGMHAASVLEDLEGQRSGGRGDDA